MPARQACRGTDGTDNELAQARLELQCFNSRKILLADPANPQDVSTSMLEEQAQRADSLREHLVAVSAHAPDPRDNENSVIEKLSRACGFLKPLHDGQFFVGVSGLNGGPRATYTCQRKVRLSSTTRNQTISTPRWSTQAR